jgi:two-component system, cell cycle sensor histidine kinase and response regulator CckA
VTAPKSKRIAFESARLSLARQVVAGEETRLSAIAHAAAVSAVALRIERVGVWYFEDDEQRLVCQCLYTLSSKGHSSGEVLDARTFPTYVAALRERRALAAHDARTHRMTTELTQSYLIPHDIGAMLDAPILLDGRLVGVVCHEHVGGPRVFEQHELDFAGSVADMIALIEEQSARVRLEAALREQDELVQRSAKLEALSRLARSAAHDFNNVLTAIMAAAYPLSKHGDPKLAQWADTITEAAEMGARISGQLLVLGRDQPARSTRVSLPATLDAVQPVLRARFGDELEVHSEVSASEPVVMADPAQIERILLNLCVNAGEASGGRGRVDVRVREPRAQEARGRGWLVLEVSDQGIGMSDEVKDHLFEPYFTTKPSGTGLGLASVYGIVRQLKGRIHAESVLGRGSSFIVTLPRAPHASAP